MKIRNKRSYAVEIAVGDFSAFVDPGEVADVPDDVGRLLAVQVDAWELVETKPARVREGSV